MVLLIDFLPEELIDALMRWPVAMALDYIIGSAWDRAKNPAVPVIVANVTAIKPRSSASISDTGQITLLDMLNAVSSVASYLEYYFYNRFTLTLAAFLCWMVLKFMPRTQLILFGVLTETLVIFISIFCLIFICPAVSWTTGIVIFFATEVLHAQFITNLRHLRFFEIMGTPDLAQRTGSRSSFIARSVWLTIWPTLPFVAVTCKNLEWAGYISQAAATKSSRVYLAATGILALPAMYFLLEAIRWRLYCASANLAERRRPGVRITIVGSYYFAVENLNWPSMGEERTNRAYAMVWATKLLYLLILSAIYDGPKEALYALPVSLVLVSLSSYPSFFGMCWIVAHIYHTIFTRWLYSMNVVLTAVQLQLHDMQKYDLSGHLLMFGFQAGLLSVAAFKTEWDPLLRVVCFLLLYRLPKITEYTRLYSQSVSIENTGSWRYYIQAAFEGTVAPFCLGVVLFLRVWRVPFNPGILLTALWAQEIPVTFPPEFELWLHTEALFLLVDLFMDSVLGVISTVGYSSHLYSTASPHFWHRYMARVDFFGKLWTQIIRELLVILVHFVIMSFMFERMWHDTLTSGFVGSGFADVVNFLIYFGRYADANVRFSYVTQTGLTSDVVCSYRCVIRELPAPTEDKFTEWKDVCGICQATEEDRMALCEFPCGHFFHRVCIEEWLKIRMVCPMCMRKVWLDAGTVRMDNVAPSPMVDSE